MMPQQLDFFLAIDERAQLGRMQRFEPALHGAWPEHLVRAHRLGETLQLDRAQIAVLEQITEKPMRYRADDNCAGFGERLQSRGEVGGLADNVPFLCLAEPPQFADDDHPSANADSNLEPLGCLKVAEGFDLRQTRANRSLSVILMGAWVAEIDHHSIAHVPSDKAVEAGDRVRDALVVRAQNLSQILRIEPRGQDCRAYKIAEHDRELPALGRIRARLGRRGWCSRRGGFPNGFAATTAEPGGGLVFETASWAGRGQWRSTLGTEATCRRVFGHTLWTTHPVPPRARQPICRDDNRSAMVLEAEG